MKCNLLLYRIGPFKFTLLHIIFSITSHKLKTSEQVTKLKDQIVRNASHRCYGYLKDI